MARKSRNTRIKPACDLATRLDDMSGQGHDEMVNDLQDGLVAKGQSLGGSVLVDMSSSDRPVEIDEDLIADAVSRMLPH